MLAIVNERIQQREETQKHMRQVVTKMCKLSKKEDVNNLDYLDMRVNENLISKLPAQFKMKFPVYKRT
jgi:ribosomal protein L17